MARFFVAIIPPSAVRSELAAVADGIESLRRTPEENFHLTMRYIGPREDETRPKFIEALDRVRVESFILPVGQTGIFPSRGRAKVVWAGVGNGHTRLFQLRKKIDEALLAVDMTIDVHHFHPHFTLGRLGEDYEAKGVAKFLARNADFEAPPFRVAEFHLMTSEAQPGRAPRYQSVQAFPLFDGSAI